MPVMTGTLRERVTLETPNPTQDASGQPIEDWLPTAELWASVVTAGARESIRGQQMDATTTHAVVVRYRTDLDTTKRFAWGNRKLNITKANDPDNRRAFMRCECIEDVD